MHNMHSPAMMARFVETRKRAIRDEEKKSKAKKAKQTEVVKSEVGECSRPWPVAQVQASVLVANDGVALLAQLARQADEAKMSYDEKKMKLQLELMTTSLLVHMSHPTHHVVVSH